MKTLKIIISLIVVAAVGCGIWYTLPSRNKTTDTAIHPKIGEVFTAKIGTTYSLTNEPISLKVQKITEDSRCPTDVTCIWAGRVVVELLIINAGKSQTITIGNMGGQSVITAGNVSVVRGNGPTRIGNYDISLNKVEPSQGKQGEKIAAEDYRFQFLVTK